MVLRVKHQVVVGPGGHVQITDPSLQAGSEVEVTVRVPERKSTPAEKIAALHFLQESMKLTKEHAARWIADISAERKASNRPRT